MKTERFALGLSARLVKIRAISTYFYSNRTHHINRIDDISVTLSTENHKCFSFGLNRKGMRALTKALNKALVVNYKLKKRKK